MKLFVISLWLKRDSMLLLSTKVYWFFRLTCCTSVDRIKCFQEQASLHMQLSCSIIRVRNTSRLLNNKTKWGRYQDIPYLAAFLGWLFPASAQIFDRKLHVHLLGGTDIDGMACNDYAYELVDVGSIGFRMVDNFGVRGGNCNGCGEDKPLADDNLVGVDYDSGF